MGYTADASGAHLGGGGGKPSPAGPCAGSAIHYTRGVYARLGGGGGRRPASHSTRARGAAGSWRTRPWLIRGEAPACSRRPRGFKSPSGDSRRCHRRRLWLPANDRLSASFLPFRFIHNRELTRTYARSGVLIYMEEPGCDRCSLVVRGNPIVCVRTFSKRSLRTFLGKASGQFRRNDLRSIMSDSHAQVYQREIRHDGRSVKCNIQ